MQLWLNRINWGIRVAVAVVAVALLVFSFAWWGYRRFSREKLPPDVVSLKVLHWGDKVEDEIVAKLVRDFERLPENKGIKIVRINPGQAASVRTKLQTMFAAGEPPDVFYLGLENVSDLATKNLLADIEELIERDKARGAPTLDLNDLFPATVRCFRVDPATGQVGQGRLVGLPKDFTTVGFYYNRDLFRRAGLPDPPVTGWTWEEFIAAARAIGKLPNCYGADFVTWEQMVRIYLWTYGVDFASPGWQQPYHFSNPTLFSALQRLQDWFHGETRTLLSAKTQIETMQEPFLAGNIGMAGPFGRWKVPVFRNVDAFDWDLAPLPHVKGRPPRNGVFTVAWALPRTTPHKEEAWRFVKYLMSPRGQRLMADAGLAIPVLRSIAEEAIRADAGARPQNARLLLEAADVADPTDYPPDPEFQQQLRVRLEEVFKLGRPVERSMATVEREWTENLRRAKVAREDRPIHWTRLLTLIGLPIAALAALVLAIWWRRRPAGMIFREELAGWGMLAPWLIGFLAFTAFSIGLSLILSFAKWSCLTTLDHAQYVAWDNFRSLWTRDDTFAKSLRATAWYALLAVPSGQVAALSAAMLMNHTFRSIGVFRAIWYLPSVLAGVGVAVMWKWVFHHEHGLLRLLLDPILPAGMHSPAWFEKDAETWGVPAFAIINLWAIGGTMMIYLAGLKGITRDLYEAAEIDGAVRWRKFLHVTLPMLSPVIFFNFIIALIASFQVFTQAYVMTGGGPGHATRFYVVYLYNQAFDFHEMGYASAMAWMLLVIVLVLTLVVMKGTKRFVYYEGLR
jgi:multiple sugar transport system permease protein/multiple sugar transport system substrate-binding protein